MSVLIEQQSRPSISVLDPERKRIPGLDGWRGIAIALVLFDHTQAALLGRYWWPWSQTGQHGVTIFFVLSGFLITSKLLERRVSLKRFYIRRFFRLMPVAWVYLTAFALCGICFGQRWISGSELASCLFFYRNYLGAAQYLYASHFWSLSIEEQFYVIWPSLLLLLGIRRSRWLAVAGAVSVATYRELHWAQYDQQWLSFRTEVRADALLVGCIFALLFADPILGPLSKRWVKYSYIPSAICMIFAMVYFHWLPPLFECIAIGVLITASAEQPLSLITRVLASPPFVWMGMVSYSVYVWQQFFFVHRGTVVTITMICLMPVFAIGSYYFIELPSTRLGHRLTRKPASLNLSTIDS